MGAFNSSASLHSKAGNFKLRRASTKKRHQPYNFLWSSAVRVVLVDNARGSTQPFSTPSNYTHVSSDAATTRPASLVRRRP